jgi:hypothetical protein
VVPVVVVVLVAVVLVAALAVVVVAALATPAVAASRAVKAHAPVTTRRNMKWK